MWFKTILVAYVIHVLSLLTMIVFMLFLCSADCSAALRVKYTLGENVSSNSLVVSRTTVRMKTNGN